MVRKSKINAVLPGEIDNVIRILDMESEYDRVTVDPDIDSFYEIFNNPGICRIMNAVAVDASGMRQPVPSENIRPMAALGMVSFSPSSGKTELTLWSKVISTAAELMLSHECDQCHRLVNLLDSSLSDADVTVAVRAMYDQGFWQVLGLDNKLDKDFGEGIVLKGNTRMLVGYETELDGDPED